MRHVKILSSVSGGGKSFYANNLAREYMRLTGKPACIVSVDDYFTSEGGVYYFDPSKLGEAHAQCFSRFIHFMQQVGNNLLIVSNTNTTSEEIAPYALGSSAFGYSFEVITIMCDNYAEIEAAHKRNTHNVPLQVVRNQQERIRCRRLPPYWKHVVIPFSQ